MTGLPRNRFTLVAAAGALGAAVLVTALLLRWRDDLAGVAMSLLAVLLGMVAGVAFRAARHQQAGSLAGQAAGQPQPAGMRAVDADTLETTHDPRMVARLRARRRDR